MLRLNFNSHAFYNSIVLKFLVIIAVLLLKSNTPLQAQDTIYSTHTIKVDLFESIQNVLPDHAVVGLSYEYLLDKRYSLNLKFYYMTFNMEVHNSHSIFVDYKSRDELEESAFFLKPYLKRYLINNRSKYPRGFYIGLGLPILYEYGEDEFYANTYNDGKLVHEAHYMWDIESFSFGLSLLTGTKLYLGKRFSLDFQLAYNLVYQYDKSKLIVLIEDGAPKPERKKENSFFDLGIMLCFGF